MIYIRRRVFGNGARIISPMPVVFAKRETTAWNGGKVTPGTRYIITNQWDSDIYRLSKHRPIGIAVVPPTHGGMTYGKTSIWGIMSLVPMDLNHPEVGFFENEVGGQEVTMYLGGAYDTSVYQSSGFQANDAIPIKTGDTGNNGDIGWIYGQQMNPYEGNVAYFLYQDSENSCRWNSGANNVPSPYNGTKPEYNKGGYNYGYFASPSSLGDGHHNPLSNFGNFYSKELTSLSYDYKGDLRSGPLDNITRFDSQNVCYFPAAVCCERYKVFEGSNLGGLWYLPNIGELGYISARAWDIQRTIELINSEYPQEIDPYDGESSYLASNLTTWESEPDHILWSSSLYNRKNEAFVLDVTSGRINKRSSLRDDLSGNFMGSVRAFMILDEEEEISGYKTVSVDKDSVASCFE